MKDASIFVLEPDAQEQGRMLHALAQCCDPVRIVAAASGPQALDFLLGRGEHAGRDPRKQPRLILWGLEGTDGLAVLGTVRGTAATRSVPVVVLADLAGAQAQEQWYRAGANSVVGRTPDNDELLRKLRRVHDFWMTVNEADRHSRV